MPLNADQLIAQKATEFMEEFSDRIDKILDERFSLMTPAVTIYWEEIISREEWSALVNCGHASDLRLVINEFRKEGWSFDGIIQSQTYHFGAITLTPKQIAFGASLRLVS